MQRRREKVPAYPCNASQSPTEPPQSRITITCYSYPLFLIFPHYKKAHAAEPQRGNERGRQRKPEEFCGVNPIKRKTHRKIIFFLEILSHRGGFYLRKNTYFTPEIYPKNTYFTPKNTYFTREISH